MFTIKYRGKYSTEFGWPDSERDICRARREPADPPQFRTGDRGVSNLHIATRLLTSASRSLYDMAEFAVPDWSWN